MNRIKPDDGNDGQFCSIYFKADIMHTLKIVGGLGMLFHSIQFSLELITLEIIILKVHKFSTNVHCLKWYDTRNDPNWL